MVLKMKQEKLLKSINEIKEEDIISIGINVIENKSPQTEKYESEPLVKKFITEVVVPNLRNIGIPYKIDEMGNLIAELGSSKKRGIALISYAMTPQQGSMKEAFQAKIVPGKRYGYEGKFLRGRGSCEQKGALTGMLSALRIIAKYKDKLKGKFTFICTVAGETGSHKALEHILKNHKLEANLSIVGLGTNNKICLGNKGRIDINIIISGESCHSSTPEKGINAIYGALEVLQRLKNVSLEREHPFLGKATFVPTFIESFPRATHTIQDKCIITYDRRLLPGDTPEMALAEIKEIVSEINLYKIEVKKGPFMYPYEINKDNEISKLLEIAIRQITCTKPEYTYFNSSLDAGLLNKKGIATVMLGPGDEKFAHTSDEAVSIKQIINVAKIYAYSCLSYLL